MDQPSIEPGVLNAPMHEQLQAFVDEHRERLAATLDSVTEDEARASLVPSKTTLLGLVKHAAFVERVWFDEAFTGRSRSEIGIPATPDESFTVDDGDTIACVLADHRVACEYSRRAAATRSLDDAVTGNRRGPLPLRWIYLHVLRELAQHLGHAEILREQLLAKRPS